MDKTNLKQLKDIERMRKIAEKWSSDEIDTEKDSLYANIISACDLLVDEISKEVK